MATRLTATEFLAKFPDPETRQMNLIDRACPCCGARNRFRVQVTVDGELSDSGIDVAGGGVNWEYDENSPTSCYQCDHSGIWEDFLIEGLDDLIANGNQAADGESAARESAEATS